MLSEKSKRINDLLCHIIQALEPIERRMAINNTFCDFRQISPVLRGYDLTDGGNLKEKEYRQQRMVGLEDRIMHIS